MALYRNTPPPSSRMALLFALASIQDAVIIEYGCMGHSIYARTFLDRFGTYDGAKLYSTHLDETDISLGGTQRLSFVLETVVRDYNPKAIFLLPSAVPLVIGTDLQAFIREEQGNYPEVKLVSFQTGGFQYDSYDGAEEALLTLVKEFAEETSVDGNQYNILGSFCNQYLFNEDAREYQRMLNGALKMTPGCVLTSQCTVENLKKVPQAAINLVISVEGVRAAKFLKETYGTPYVYARPYGFQQSTDWLKTIADVLGKEINQSFITKEENLYRHTMDKVGNMFMHFCRMHPEESKLSVGGGYDTVKGISTFATEQLQLPLGLIWTDYKKSPDIPVLTQDKAIEQLEKQEGGLIMADSPVLERIGGDKSLQLSASVKRWKVNHYQSPLVGYRGGLNLIDLWLNSLTQQD